MVLYRKLKTNERKVKVITDHEVCIFTTFYKQNLIIKRHVDSRYIVIIIDSLNM